MFLTVVGRQRADKRVVLVLLHDVGGPTGDTRHHKDRGEELDIESKDVVRRASSWTEYPW